MPKRKIRELSRLLNPIDDVMFRKMAEYKGFCEEILRVILDDDNLIVTESIAQWEGTNLQGRSVVLDAKCISGDGRHINIEVQKENDDDHLKRVRYNGSILTTNITNPGTRFEAVPDICIIFISKFDIFKCGFPVYHVDKVVRETGEIIDDGLTEIYVTTVKKDGSKVSKLMELFIKDDAYNTEDFPVTSEIKARFKISEGGRKEMNEMLEKIIREEKEESERRGEKRGEKRGKKEGKIEGKIEGANEEKIRIAKDMKKEGLAHSLIAKLTGISEKKIMAL